jgi:phosphoribosylformimino-5-aminoimidazole carboxamide ribonucleotide (ProFAR) isomerase
MARKYGNRYNRLFKSYVLKGIRYTICTDIEKDGMLLGPSVSLYKDILEAVSINLIASGALPPKKTYSNSEVWVAKAP